MLAVDITAQLPDPESRSDQALRRCVDQSWTITRAALDRDGDAVMAIGDGRIAGIWTITATHRDPESDTVTFELAEAPQWAWAIGRSAPRTHNLSRSSGLRSIRRIHVTALWDERPSTTESTHGWTLEVAADGLSATVRGPSPHLRLATLTDGTATLTLSDPPKRES